jgi:hypothetical protein
MWREPLTGNMGENFVSHKPVHETTTDSCTGGNATKWDSHLRGLFLPDESRIVSSTPPRARLSHEEPDAGKLHIRVCEG